MSIESKFWGSSTTPVFLIASFVLVVTIESFRTKVELYYALALLVF